MFLPPFILGGIAWNLLNAERQAQRDWEKYRRQRDDSRRDDTYDTYDTDTDTERYFPEPRK